MFKGETMNMLLVGYDLNSKGQKYAELIEFLKGQANWWHYLDSTWLVKTQKSASQMRDELIQLGFIDDNDELLVINVTGQSAAWVGFNDEGSTWLKSNL